MEFLEWVGMTFKKIGTF